MIWRMRRLCTLWTYSQLLREIYLSTVGSVLSAVIRSFLWYIACQEPARSVEVLRCNTPTLQTRTKPVHADAYSGADASSTNCCLCKGALKMTDLKMKDQTLVKSRTWKCRTWKWRIKMATLLYSTAGPRNALTERSKGHRSKSQGYEVCCSLPAWVCMSIWLLSLQIVGCCCRTA